jgi:hypothetical protein
VYHTWGNILVVYAFQSCEAIVPEDRALDGLLTGSVHIYGFLLLHRHYSSIDGNTHVYNSARIMGGRGATTLTTCFFFSQYRRTY